MDTRDDQEAVIAPARPVEVIVIPSYDTPGDVFPGWKPLPVTVAAPAPLVEVAPAPVPEPVVAAPAPLAPVEVAEPELEYTHRTFDDHFATGLVVARYTLFAMIAGLLCAGAYAVVSVAAANTFTIGLAILLIAVIAFFGLRSRGALTAARERAAGAVPDMLDETDGSSPVGSSTVIERLTGRVSRTSGGSLASVLTGRLTAPNPANAARWFAAGAVSWARPAAGRVPGVEIGHGAPARRPEFDELTGSWDSWDGQTTPTGPTLAQRNAQTAREATVNPHAAGRQGFTGQVSHRAFEDPSSTAWDAARQASAPAPGRWTSLARQTLFDAPATASSVAGTAPGAGQALDPDAARSVAAGGGFVRRSVYGGGIARGVGADHLMGAWIDELRSSCHEQARGVLREAKNKNAWGMSCGGLCARGLLFNTADPDGWFWRKGPTVWIRGVPMSSGGWDHRMRVELDERHSDVVWEAERMNDELGASWPEIADFVESKTGGGFSDDAKRAMATGGTVSRSIFGAGGPTERCPEAYLTGIWVASMRSGLNERLQGRLRVAPKTKIPGYAGEAVCAQGLLYNIADPNGWFWGRCKRELGGNWDHVMRPELETRYGHSFLGQVQSLNDGGAGFPAIADYAESNARV